MVARLTEVIIDCRDPARLASFWSAVLGYHVVFADDEQVEIAAWEKEPPDLAQQVRRAPGVPTIVFVVVPESKTIKNRVHLDVRPVDVAYDDELRRLLDLGATHVDIGQGSVKWTVLADPEGNEFCLLGPLPAEA
jgi:catechol 2,3-dioxygenase-like lactoylglutathione lyase family enzyme